MDGLSTNNAEKYISILKQDKANEDSVIGFIIDNEAAALTAAKIINPKSFIYSFNTHIFNVLVNHLEDGKSIKDVHATLASITEDDWSKIAPVDTTDRDEHLVNCRLKAISLLSNPIGVEGFFQKINEQYLRRLLIEELTNRMNVFLNTNGVHNLVTVAGEGVTRINSLLDLIITEDREKSYPETVREILDHKEKEAISTGYTMLDNIMEGFQGGELITIAAATGVGKSAFAINLALNIVQQGFKVALWSFEMSEYEIIQRILSNVTGISKGNKRQKEERYNRAREYLENQSDAIKIKTHRIKDMNNFYLQCRKLKLKQNIKIIIIDYLQLIHLSGFSSYNRTTEVEYITNLLKSIASELDITIVILSQLSRTHQQRNDKTPILSDLRDSGSIEQDSNKVIFLHKLEEQPIHNQDTEKTIQILVAKNRSGRIGSFYTKYTGYLTKFEQIERG